MRPAGATVLWDVLVQGSSAIVHTIFVTPIEIVREATIRLWKIVMGGTRCSVPTPDNAKQLGF